MENIQISCHLFFYQKILKYFNEIYFLMRLISKMNDNSSEGKMSFV